MRRHRQAVIAYGRARPARPQSWAGSRSADGLEGINLVRSPNVCRWRGAMGAVGTGPRTTKARDLGVATMSNGGLPARRFSHDKKVAPARKPSVASQCCKPVLQAQCGKFGPVCKAVVCRVATRPAGPVRVNRGGNPDHPPMHEKNIPRPTAFGCTFFVEEIKLLATAVGLAQACNCAPL